MKKDEKKPRVGATSCPASGKQQGAGSADSLDAFLEQQKLDGRMQKIKHKIIVLSGKGGVGKSTVAANLAISLSMSGKKVGLLDIDIHGPSIPKMLKLDLSRINVTDGVIHPVEKGGMKVVSIGFLLKDRDDAVIWRGPMKAGVIKQFLSDVEWGELDYLIIDSPPGTGDEPLSVCQLLKNPDGAVVVTTPQDVAVADVRKSINFCRQLKIPVLGVVENMSGFVCPKCRELTQIFKTGGGERMSDEMKVPFLGRIPIDPGIGESCDSGNPFIYDYSKTETGKAFEHIIEPILALSVLDDEVLQKDKRE
jgi:Mrp family chromosome partitioning ATPase